MIPARASSNPEFRMGDKVVVAEGTYQGTLGVFLGLREDANWADIQEFNGVVRSHPVRWLAKQTEELESRRAISQYGGHPKGAYAMSRTRIAALSILWIVLSAPLLDAGDLSRYREFQFGTDLPAVAKQAGVKPSDAQVIHQRPALIQELEWQPQDLSGYSGKADSIKDIRFSFYNGELFQIVVNYDRYRTEGLTAEDLISAISAQYGTATKPDAEIMFPSLYQETVKVIARWEDSQYSLDLVRSSYQHSFGIVVWAKRLDALARTATTEALRLDEQEAPQRELEHNKREEAENLMQQERARQVNKPGFRP